MRDVNTDTKYYMTNIPERSLHDAAKLGGKMYPENCLQQRQHFLPLIVSVGRLMGFGVEATLKRISIRITTKWQKL